MLKLSLQNMKTRTKKHKATRSLEKPHTKKPKHKKTRANQNKVVDVKKTSLHIGFKTKIMPAARGHDTLARKVAQFN